MAIKQARAVPHAYTFVMTRDGINAAIKSHIVSTGSKFATVVFVKKDGSIRRMRMVTAEAHRRDMIGSERGKLASATRAINHPNILPVWDTEKRAFRSVNLDTVLTVQAHGRLVRYRELVERRQWLLTAA